MKENKSNGLDDIISQAIEEMKLEQGKSFLSGKDQSGRVGASDRHIPCKTAAAQEEWLCPQTPRAGKAQGASFDSDRLYSHLRRPAREGNHQLLGLPGTASVCGIFRRADNG